MTDPTKEQIAQWALEASATGDETELSGDSLYSFVIRAMAEQAKLDAALCEGLPAGTGPHAFAFAIRANAPKEKP